jgi:hypothetical protein
LMQRLKSWKWFVLYSGHIIESVGRLLPHLRATCIDYLSLCPLLDG